MELTDQQWRVIAPLFPAGLDVILALLAGKESRLCDRPPGTPLIPLDADPGDVLGEEAVNHAAEIAIRAAKCQI